MSDVLNVLTTDLAAEVEATLEILQPDCWDVPTPADPWTIGHQIAHLAGFDEVATTALTQPRVFEWLRRGIVDVQGLVDIVGMDQRSNADLASWWRSANAQFCQAAATGDPRRRVPWFGPDMSLPSMVTARLMETWAHGQDIRDALGVASSVSPRLRHVARLGALTVDFSFRNAGLEPPGEPIDIALIGPDGDTWTFGDSTGSGTIRGTALDFCLVATRRRHVADTDLEVTGSAVEWAEVAQSFAGPPGAGRSPGQFPRTSRTTNDTTQRMTDV